MFCKNCGKQLSDEELTCPECGTTIAEQAPDPKQNDAQVRTVDMNTFAIVGFILSFFSSIVGLVLSIFGLIHANKYYAGKGKGFAIAGIVVGSVFWVVYIIYSFALLGQISRIIYLN